MRAILSAKKGKEILLMKEKTLKKSAHFISVLLNIGCIGKGNSPFTPNTAVQIRKIAIYVVLFAVFASISAFKLSFPSLLMCGLFALILFCISLIFDYGCVLQQEVDETL